LWLRKFILPVAKLWACFLRKEYPAVCLLKRRYLESGLRFLSHSLTKAQIFADKYGIPQSAGSDAHTVNEIGNAYVEMPEFNGRDDFLQALAAGKVSGHRTNPLIHFASAWTRLKGNLKRYDDDV